jgi:hypothetical protein
MYDEKTWKVTLSKRRPAIPALPAFLIFFAILLLFLSAIGFYSINLFREEIQRI